jgi:hypothetical protein
MEEQISYCQNEQNFVLTMLCIKDILLNGYYVETNNEGSDEYFYITSIISGQKLILKKLHVLFFRMYYTTIRTIESHVVMHQKCSNPNMFMLWHDCLGHSSTIMMLQIIENSHGHSLKN